MQIIIVLCVHAFSGEGWGLGWWIFYLQIWDKGFLLMHTCIAFIKIYPIPALC